mgnify:CR=1 FL=1
MLLDKPGEANTYVLVHDAHMLKTSLDQTLIMNTNLTVFVAPTQEAWTTRECP